jgi:outer membrane protein OmpA-like peptidoglycan-associated protein
MTFKKKGAAIAAVFLLLAVSAFAQREPVFILFPANSAELRTMGAEQAVRNAQMLTKVAQLLLDDPKCRILVDGHANPIVGTAHEETGTLRPLSIRRASVTVDFLVSYYGVDRNRLIISGAGGRFPGGGDHAEDRRVSFFKIPPK